MAACPSAAELARVLNAKRSGSGWSAKCPCHDDDNPSLSIREGPNGEVWVTCHARCERSAIFAAAGFTPTKPNGHDRTRKSRIVEIYDYTDAKGELVYQVVRKAPKTFPQRRPNGSGGWIWNLDGVEVVPYRLPELLNADEIFITEGEKDANNVARLGLASTTNPGGAGKWRPEFARFFFGRHVVILPDNDAKGRAHAESVPSNLNGTASSIRVVELPGLADKGDISDWLEAGGTLAELQRLVAATAYWAPAPEPVPKPRAVEVLSAWIAAEFRPLFRENQFFWSRTFEQLVRPSEVVPTVEVIDQLATSSDARRDTKGEVMPQALPTLARTWVGPALAATMRALPLEADAPEVCEAAALRFRQRLALLLSTMVTLSQVSTGEQHRRDDYHERRDERRSLRGWAEVFAKPDLWSQLRTYRLWFRHTERLEISVRPELAHQVGWNTDIARMDFETFVRLAESYGAGQRVEFEYCGTVRAVLLTPAFLAFCS
jgi:hypothetical protein